MYLPLTAVCLSSHPVPIFTRADPFPGRAQRKTGVFHGSFQKRRSVVVQILLRRPNPCAPKGLSDHTPLIRYHKSDVTNLSGNTAKVIKVMFQVTIIIAILGLKSNNK